MGGESNPAFPGVNEVWDPAPDRPLYSLKALLGHDESEIRQIMGNGKVAPSSARCRYKSIAIMDVAGAFYEEGIDTAEDLRKWIGQGEGGFEELKRIYTGVHGLGPVTFEYWLMLLGVPGVKADRRVVSFVADALRGVSDRRVGDARFVRQIVAAAYSQWKAEAEQIRRGVSLIDFDHAIWLYNQEQSG